MGVVHPGSNLGLSHVIFLHILLDHVYRPSRDRWGVAIPQFGKVISRFVIELNHFYPVFLSLRRSLGLG
eukprot:1027761-Amorphochlora_amoeboformis.AAC.1